MHRDLDRARHHDPHAVRRITLAEHELARAETPRYPRRTGQRRENRCRGPASPALSHPFRSCNQTDLFPSSKRMLITLICHACIEWRSLRTGRGGAPIPLGARPNRATPRPGPPGQRQPEQRRRDAGRQPEPQPEAMPVRQPIADRRAPHCAPPAPPPNTRASPPAPTAHAPPARPAAPPSAPPPPAARQPPGSPDRPRPCRTRRPRTSPSNTSHRSAARPPEPPSAPASSANPPAPPAPQSPAPHRHETERQPFRHEIRHIGRRRPQHHDRHPVAERRAPRPPGDPPRSPARTPRPAMQTPPAPAATAARSKDRRNSCPARSPPASSARRPPPWAAPGRAHAPSPRRP